MLTSASKSFLGMGVALTLQMLMALLSALVSLVTQAVRGIGKSIPKAPPVEAPIEVSPPGKIIPFPKQPAPAHENPGRIWLKI